MIKNNPNILGKIHKYLIRFLITLLCVILHPLATYAADDIITDKASASVSLGDLSATYDGSAKSASATTVPAGLNVTLTYGGLATAPTAAGAYAVVATIDDANYAGSTSGSLVIGKAYASVVLSNLYATYNGSAKSASATTVPAGLNVTLTYDGSATAPTAARTYAVVATINDANYAGSASGSLVIGKASQTILFEAIPDQTLGAPALNLSATSTSGLTVGFTVVSGSALLSGSQLSTTGLGDVVIEATQSGNANWLPATAVRRTFRVNAGDFAQGYIWARGFGASGLDNAYAVAADASGNVYVGDGSNYQVVVVYGGDVSPPP